MKSTYESCGRAPPFFLTFKRVVNRKVAQLFPSLIFVLHSWLVMSQRITRSQTITAIDAKVASESTHTFQNHSQPIKERSATFDDLVPEERTLCLIKEIKSRDIPTRMCVRFYRSVHRTSTKAAGNNKAGKLHKGHHSETFSIGDTVEFRTNTGEIGVAVIIALYELDLAEDASQDLPFQWGRFKARLHRFQIAGRTRVNMHVQQRLSIPVRDVLKFDFLFVHTRIGRNILLSLCRFCPHRPLVHSSQMHRQAQGREGCGYQFTHFAYEEGSSQPLSIQDTISQSPRCLFTPV
jgi:hypothetical protein